MAGGIYPGGPRLMQAIPDHTKVATVEEEEAVCNT